MIDKPFILKNKNGYFVYKNFFEDPIAPDILIVISIRNSGKTTGAMCLALENWFKYRKRFVWCRRKKVEIDQIKADIGNFNMFKWKGKIVRIIRQGDKLFVNYNDQKELIGWLVNISTFHNIKGRDFVDCSLFIFDEFMSENNIYLCEEWRMFTNTLTTVQRNREPFKLILLGNNIDPFNIYIQKFQFEIKKGEMLYKKELTFENKTTKVWLINDKDLSTLHKRHAHTLAYQIASIDQEANDYLILGKFRETNLWMCSTIAYIIATPEYNFWLFGHAFHSRYLNDEIYLVKGFNEKCIHTFALTQRDQLEQNTKAYDFHPLALKLYEKMKNRKLWFDNQIIFDLVLQWFRNFKPREVL